MLCTVGALTCTHARAQESLAGAYKASTEVTKVEVSTWGEDCGPRPQSASVPSKATVNVKVQGTQLVLAFPDRTLRSDGCWSPNPAVRVASSTAAAQRWRTECQTAQTDPKRERGVYTLSASAEGTLDLLEESSYDWQLNQSRCVAKIRVTQRLARGAALAQLDKAPVETPAACVPGPLAKLRLRPRDVRLAPGDKACFSVRAVDAAGCALPEPGALKWELVKAQGATATLAGGCFKAAASAAEAEGQFKVVVSVGSVHDDTPVTVATADLSDITARRSNDGSELSPQGEVEGAASSFGARAAVARSSLPVKAALAALVLAMLAGVAWFLTARARRRRLSQLALDDTQDATPSQRPVARPAMGTSGSTEPLICPKCRHGYPAGTTRCSRDGETPIPYAEYTKLAAAAQAGPRTCTACGAQLDPSALFCGACGAKVRS